MGDQVLTPGKARSWRVSAGLPLIAVGRKARIERTRLGMWESGHLDLRSDEIKRLQRVLLEGITSHLESIAAEFSEASATEAVSV
jgi:hypothetical protein